MTRMLVRTIMIRPSAIAALAASLLLVGIKLLFELYPGDFPARGQAEAFTWLVVGGVILIGLLGLLAEQNLSADGRFPEPFTDRKRERRALLIATATGASYGLITAAFYLVCHVIYGGLGPF